jgi:plastocyanin
MKKLNAVIAGAALVASSAALAAGGTIAGSIGFTGTAPKMEKLKRTSDPVCAKKEMTDETVTLSSDGKSVANVVVRLKNGPAGTAPADPIIIDQNDCMYRPRVQAAVEGQKVQIRNSDGTLHNVHAYGVKPSFNQAQPPKSKPIEKAFTREANQDVVTLKCDVHPWMRGFVVYSKGPHFAVTKEDGKFEIKDVPAGTYTVEAWHEKLGTVTAEVKVEDGKSIDPKLSLAAK